MLQIHPLDYLMSHIINDTPITGDDLGVDRHTRRDRDALSVYVDVGGVEAHADRVDEATGSH